MATDVPVSPAPGARVMAIRALLQPVCASTPRAVLLALVRRLDLSVSMGAPAQAAVGLCLVGLLIVERLGEFLT